MRKYNKTISIYISALGQKKNQTYKDDTLIKGRND